MEIILSEEAISRKPTNWERLNKRIQRFVNIYVTDMNYIQTTIFIRHTKLDNF